MAVVAVLAALGVNAARERAEERRREADELSRDRRGPQARSRPPARRLAAAHHAVDARPGPELARGQQSPGGVALAGAEPRERDRTRTTRSSRRSAATWRPGARSSTACGIASNTQAPVRVVAWSPTGRSVATGSDDGIVRLWDPALERMSRCRQERSSTPARCTAWRSRATARPWRPAAKTRPPGSGTRARACRGVSRCATGGRWFRVAFSPDGSTLVTASGDGTGPALGRGDRPAARRSRSSTASRCKRS